jgi:hypothetical protein
MGVIIALVLGLFGFFLGSFLGGFLGLGIEPSIGVGAFVAAAGFLLGSN